MNQAALSTSITKKASRSSPKNSETGKSAKDLGKAGDYLQAIIDSLEDELLVVGRDYRIIQANEAVLFKHGKRRQEIIGELCYEVAHGLPEFCHPPYHTCPINEVWETKKPARTTHVHVYYSRGEKRERFLDIIATPIKDKQGNVTAVAELMRDVTEAKELELQIAEAHRSLLALNSISTALSLPLDLDTILSTALDKTMEIVNVEIGGIMLLDKASQVLRYRVYRGLSDEYAREMIIPLGEGIAGKVAQSGQPLLLEDIFTDHSAAYPELVNIEGLRAFVSIPLIAKGETLGVLNIASHEAHKFFTQHIQTLNSIAIHLTIAIENASLHQEVQLKDESRGELLGEIFSIQEEERRRIARELHDETSQSLASLAANLEAASGMLPASAAKVEVILRKSQEISVNILDEIHKLIYELRPLLLDDLGLVAAVRWLAENNLKTDGVTVNFKTSGRIRRLAPQLETILFRVIQEAINNISRHAHAKKSGVSLHFKKSFLSVHIKDDGRGFDVQEAITSKDRPRGLGLLGMKERVEMVNGTLDIQSRPEGDGTVIKINIPAS
ncbi:GAF domain-containing protein [Chloroflexota bacterium]